MSDLKGFPAQFLEHCLRERLFTSSKVVVAVSGGADSLTLLHLLHTLRERLNLELHVAHFDHQIRAESADDAQFVADLAKSLSLPCTIGHEDIPARAQRDHVSIEVAARAARYTFLAHTAHTENALQIVTAHHRDDQAETVLMHLIRGTGLAGLRGMLPRSELQGNMMLVRPLLPFSRAQIETYLHDHHLTPRLDSTNADTTYLRNRLRLEIIPLLKTINPALDAALSQLATLAQEDFAALTALLPSYPYDRVAFATLPLSVQRLALQQNPVRRDSLTFHDVENALVFIARGKPGEVITLSNELTVALDFDHIRFDEKIELHAPGLSPGTCITINPDSLIALENGWQLQVSAQPTGEPDEITLLIPKTAKLTLRTRRNGDRFHPEGMNAHSQKLSDTLINMKVPAVWRDHVPLLMSDDYLTLLIAPTPDGIRVRKAEPLSSFETLLFIKIKFTPDD